MSKMSITRTLRAVAEIHEEGENEPKWARDAADQGECVLDPWRSPTGSRRARSDERRRSPRRTDGAGGRFGIGSARVTLSFSKHLVIRWPGLYEVSGRPTLVAFARPMLPEETGGAGSEAAPPIF
jgi:hypothetical protein